QELQGVADELGEAGLLGRERLDQFRRRLRPVVVVKQGVPLFHCWRKETGAQFLPVALKRLDPDWKITASTVLLFSGPPVRSAVKTCGGTWNSITWCSLMPGEASPRCELALQPSTDCQSLPMVSLANPLVVVHPFACQILVFRQP